MGFTERTVGWAAKAVIKGKAFNTATATLIHRDYEGEEYNTPFGPRVDGEELLYRNRHGAFFVVRPDVDFYNPAIQEVDFKTEIEPISPDQALEWMEKHCQHKIELVFGDQPEAGETESTLYIRLPDILKAEIVKAAASEKQSVNAWMVAKLSQMLVTKQDA